MRLEVKPFQLCVAFTTNYAYMYKYKWLYTHITKINWLEGIKHLISADRYCHILVPFLYYEYCTGNGGKELIPKEKGSG